MVRVDVGVKMVNVSMIFVEHYERHCGGNKHMVQISKLNNET